MNSKAIVYNNKKYDSTNSLCDELELSRSSVFYYSKVNGCSKQEAIRHYLELRECEGSTRGLAGERYILDGKPFVSRAAIARHLGVNVGPFNEMVNRLGTVDAAVKYYKYKVNPIYTVGGKSFTSYKAAAESLGATRTNVYHLSKRRNISIQEALDIIVNEGIGNVFNIDKSERKYHVGDTTDLTLEEASGLVKASGKTIAAQASRTGKSRQSILDLRYKELLGRQRMINGTLCSFKSEMARALGVDETTFRAAVSRNGNDVDKSITYFLEQHGRLNSIAISKSLCNELCNVHFVYIGRKTNRRYYKATCNVCWRTFILSDEEAYVFKHSTEFCMVHEFKG